MPQYNAYIQPKKYGNLRRRRKIAVFLAAFFALSAIFAGAAWLIFYSPVFEIKNTLLVCEDGGVCRTENEEKLKNILDLFFNRNFFLNFKKNKTLLFKNADLEKFISANAPKIDLRGIEKNFFNRTLKINYSERKMAGIYCSARFDAENIIPGEIKDEILDENTNTDFSDETSEEIGPCFYIDKTGTAYEEAPQSSGSLIIFVKDYENGIAEIGKQAVNPEIFTAVSRIDNLFRENLNIEISEIKLNSRGKNSIEIAVKTGWSAIFNSKDAETAFSAMRTILEKEIKEKQSELEYIDLRFGTKVYYKFRETK